jgi:hypothetical protein
MPGDVDNRLLVITDTEAVVVRRIFEEMLTIGSPTQIAANLTLDDVPPPGRPARGHRRAQRPRRDPARRCGTRLLLAAPARHRRDAERVSAHVHSKT